MFQLQSSMRQTRGVVVVLLSLVFLGGCGKQYDEDATLGSGKLRWSSFPVRIQADSSLFDGGPAEQDLRAAVSFWETRAGKQLFELGTWPSGQAPYVGEVTHPQSLLGNAIFFQNPWPNFGDWGPEIAGRTIVNSTKGSITHAVVFLNAETNLCSDLCATEGGTSRRRLIAHELGHFLGFAHVQDMANIMFPTIQVGGSLDSETIDSDLLRRLTQ
jgi:hypothetical protein